MKKYVSSCCEQERISGWSDKEAMKDKEENFPGVPMSEMVTVCETCYHDIMEYVRGMD